MFVFINQPVFFHSIPSPTCPSLPSIKPQSSHCTASSPVPQSPQVKPSSDLHGSWDAWTQNYHAFHSSLFLCNLVIPPYRKHLKNCFYKLFVLSRLHIGFLPKPTLSPVQGLISVKLFNLLLFSRIKSQSSFTKAQVEPTVSMAGSQQPARSPFLN